MSGKGAGSNSGGKGAGSHSSGKGAGSHSSSSAAASTSSAAATSNKSKGAGAGSSSSSSSSLAAEAAAAGVKVNQHGIPIIEKSEGAKARARCTRMTGACGTPLTRRPTSRPRAPSQSGFTSPNRAR